MASWLPQLQYSIQGLNCDDPQRKDMLLDIGTDELCHPDIAGALARAEHTDRG